MLHIGDMSTKTPPFVTVRRAAKQLGLPAAWLRRETEAGRLPSIRAGKSRLVDPEMIRAALHDRAEATTEQNGGDHADA